MAKSTSITALAIAAAIGVSVASAQHAPGDAAEYIIEHLSTKKYKGRKVRLEEADQKPFGGGGGDRGGSRGPKPSGPRYSGDVKSYGGNRDGGGGGYKGKKKF